MLGGGCAATLSEGIAEAGLSKHSLWKHNWWSGLNRCQTSVSQARKPVLVPGTCRSQPCDPDLLLSFIASLSGQIGNTRVKERVLGC